MRLRAGYAWIWLVVFAAGVNTPRLVQAKLAESAPELAAYRLTESEEAEFSPSDGKPARFWARFPRSGDGVIALLPSTHHHQGGRDEFSSDDDAKLFVRAAHGTRGVYLYIEVTDDEWSPIFAEAGYDYAYDGIELMWDARSAEEIATCGQKCRPEKLSEWDVTDSTRVGTRWGTG